LQIDEDHYTPRSGDCQSQNAGGAAGMHPGVAAQITSDGIAYVNQGGGAHSGSGFGSGGAD
jgi:hypothetical protein